MRAIGCVAILATAILATQVCAQGPGMMPGAGMGPGMGHKPGPGGAQDYWSHVDFMPVVGSWAEYRITTEEEEPISMRVSVVGQEDEDYWYETVMTDDEGKQVITKMLVSGDPADKENLKRMILKAGDEPAMEMPMQMMKMGQMQKPKGEPEEAPEVTSADLGVESVTVPAGTFDAQHWRWSGEETYDAWISQGVGPYGLVKSASGEFEMVLLAHGDDAESLITETPQSLPMPGFKMPGTGE